MTKNGKRVAWVTGGGSGIGEAGAEALDAVVGRSAGAGGQAEAIPLDVSVAADVEKVAGEIVARHGRIDPAFARTTTEWC
jgi:NAD(P)-dependent dehydrogenase (short-subunit alcohol dehydrogenase family)